MVNPSKRILLYALGRIHSHGLPSTSLPHTSTILPRLSSPVNPFRNFSSQSLPSGSLPNLSSTAEIWCRLSSRNVPSCGSLNSRRFSTGISSRLPPLPSGAPGLGGILGRRLFSAKSVNPVKFDVNAVKSVVATPLSAVASTASKYRQAAGLQLEAFWRRNYLVLVGAVAVCMCLLLWRIMFGIANMFVGLSEGMAKYGFLALASAMVAFAGLYIRSRFAINPDKIYRIAMRKLNTSAGILEIMGAPLAGTDVRAYVMSGGGLKLKNFKLKLRGKRCFLIFPIRGSERRGLISVEAKKKKGQYDMRLLAVDIPMASGPDQRVFLIGDAEEYKVGGGLISELRDPIVKAMAAEKEFEELDQKEEEEDAERELQEEERKRREEAEKLQEK